MKKGVLIALIFIIVFSSIVSAATNSTNTTISTSTQNTDDGSIDKAYQCLESQLSNKTSFSLQEAVFGELALGEKDKLKAKIDLDKKPSAFCWPTSCAIKDTAQVMLAYDSLGKDTSGIKSWLLSKNFSLTETELEWFLEIDISRHVPAECTITYGNSERKFRINGDMKLELLSSDSGCFSIIPSGYWLKINENCYGKSFQISCTDDFITTLLYSKSGDTIYVSSSTHSAPTSGTTTEQINAKCFKASSSSSCDYEGSLWATLALQKTGFDVSSFTPYLIALSSENEQYFPYPFIYIVSGGADQYDKIIKNQKQNKFWEAPSTRYNKYYDTSLAMLSISGSGAVELENAKKYLIAIQSNQGCWNNNNFKDTAFLLHSGWPREISASASSSGTLISATTPCEVSGSTRSCEFSYSCAQAGGSVLSGFSCDGAKSCCSIKVQQQSCSSKGGVICLADEQCSGSTVPASEGSCCLGTCEKIELDNTCTIQAGGVCKSSCSSNEEAVSAQCLSSTDVCCKQKTSQGFSIPSWLIWFFIILIIIILILIFFRDKLTALWFKLKSRPQNKSQPPQRFSPGMPPRPMQRPMFRQPQPSSRPLPSSRKPLSQSEKELEETLKKLRDMSK